MNDDPQVSKLPEPDQPPETGADASQPEASPEPRDAETLQREQRLQEVRQDLVSAEKGARQSGGLLHRLTGSLRRPSSRPREESEPPAALPDTPEPVEHAEIADDFLADRLGGTEVSDPQQPALEEVDPELWAAFVAEAQAATPQDADAPAAGMPAADELELTADEPGDADHSRLQHFLSGLLRRGEREQGDDAVTDDLVAGRLERSLGRASDPEPAPPEAYPTGDPEWSGSLWADDATGSGEPVDPDDPARSPELVDENLLFGAPLQDAAEDSEADDFLASLKARLGALDESAAGAPAGDAMVAPEGPTFTPLDIWEETGESVQPGAFAPLDDEAFAASFLTGDAIEPARPAPYSQDRLLREALDQSAAAESGATMDDLRSVALDDYQEEGAAPHAPRMEDYVSPLAGAAAGEAGQDRSSDAQTERRWGRLFKGILVIEAVLVVVVLALAIPFFVFMINRGAEQPVAVAPVDYPAPRPLPGDLPHPTGVLLPGGWFFPLQKSTFVAGRWQPAGSEWLEGTELRRVIALPWNPQTEAVVRSFQPGDSITLDMSNNQRLTFTVTEIQRVAQADNQVLADPSPSLVIVLYQEDSPERWLVIAEP